MGCNIIAAHPMVSGYHADLVVYHHPGGRYYLFIDHSTNGTMINGRLLHNASCLVAYRDLILLASVYPFNWQAVHTEPRLDDAREQPVTPKRQSMAGAVSETLSGFFDFESSIDRRTYRLVLVWLILSFLLISAVIWSMKFLSISPILHFVISILLLLPLCFTAFSLSIRRLNDIRLNFAWSILMFIPVVNLFVIVYLASVYSKPY